MGGSSRAKVSGALNSLIAGLTGRALVVPSPAKFKAGVFNTYEPEFWHELSECSPLHGGCCGKARGNLLLHMRRRGTRFEEENRHNSEELMVLQERIELSTSPLPSMCPSISKGCKAFHSHPMTIDLQG
jgi:hypothetical protein